MLETSLNSQLTTTATDFEKQRNRSVLYNVLIMSGIGILSLYFLLSEHPDWTKLAWAAFFIAMWAVFYQPRYGLYAIMFFSLVGDIRISHFLPFDKNLSSEESIFYLHDSAAVSPVEILFTLTIGSWLLRLIMRKELNTIKYGALFWITSGFVALALFGFVTGVLRGGDIFIAQLELRPILYVIIMLTLTQNLITNPKHINNLVWAIMFALFIEGLFAIYFVQFSVFEVSDELTEHSASIHYNTMFTLFAASWVIKNGSWYKRLCLPILIPPVFYSFYVSDRRSAILALIIALGMVGLFLYQERRVLFNILVPTAIIGGLLYLGAFWNNTSPLGKPAQTIKTVIAPEQGSAKDQGSNYYRFLEDLNTYFTIQQSPILGIGFGNKFYQIVQMPDISFFIFWEYITHNSIFWIWMQMGVFGFIVMLYMISISIIKASRIAWRLPSSELKVFAIVSTTFLFMHFIYAYVDISWTSQSMLYLGVTLGLIKIYEDFGERLENGETIDDLYAIEM